MATNTDTISEDELSQLPPSEARKYRRKKIHRLIREHPMEGLTQAAISREVGFSENTVRKYLETLESQRKIYKTQRAGANIYRPNGKPTHSELDRTFNTDSKRLTFQLLDNPRGQEVFIQEKEKDNGMWEDKGGITIPAKQFSRFVSLANQYLKEINQVEVQND